MIFFIYQLHLFNLPLAFLLTFFGEVHVFKFHGSCQRFLHHSRFHPIHDFENVDQWRKTRDQTFYLLKQHFKENEFRQSKKRVEGIECDYTAIFHQSFVREFEQYIFYLTLIKNYHRPYKIIPSSFALYLKRYYPKLYEPKSLGLDFSFTFNFTRTIAIIEWTFNLFEAKKLWLKYCAKFVLKRNNQLKNKTFKYVWAAISAVEYPKNQIDLNFTWPCFQEITSYDESLFILGTPLDQSSIQYLKDQPLNTIERNQLIGVLSYTKKMAIIAKQTVELFKISFNINYESSFIFSTHFENLIWKTLFHQIGCEFYIYNFSAGWPDLPEVTIAKKLQIKTICWFYGTSEFGYTKDNENFTDMSVRFSIRLSDETWIWNNLLKKLLEERTLMATSNQIVVVGPILQGNWNRINHAPSNSSLFNIAFFDITPMKPAMRLQYGEGPYCNQTMQNEIYKIALELLNKFSDIEITIKTKRAENLLVYEDLPALRELQNQNNARIKMLPFNSDPYIAIANADLVISTPFTSPSLLAHAFGTPGIYLDPIQLAKHSYQEAFSPLTYTSKQQLEQLIEQLKMKKTVDSLQGNRQFFPLFTTEQIKKNLINRLQSLSNQKND